MTKWEYNQASITDKILLTDFLNSIGESGWELVHLQHDVYPGDKSGAYRMYFKRPKDNQLSGQIEYMTKRYLDYMPTDEELNVLGKEGWQPWHTEWDYRKQDGNSLGILRTGHVTFTVRFYREGK